MTQNTTLEFMIMWKQCEVSPLLANTRLRDIWFLPVLVTGLLAVAQITTFQVGAYYDDAWYVALGSALARGQGYTRLWTPANDAETYIPPGYPALLAPLRSAFPESFVPLQALSLIAALATVVLCAWYYRKRLTGLWLPGAVFLLAVNVAFVRFSTLVMTEAIYTLVSMFACVLADRASRSDRTSFSGALVLGLVATSAYAVRAWGISLVGALVVYFLIRRKTFNALVVLLVFTAAYLLWSVRNAAQGGVGASYGVGLSTLIPFLQDLVQDLPSKVTVQWLQNLPDFMAPLLFGPRILAFLGQVGLAPVVYGAGALIILILVAGYLVEVRRALSPAELYVPLYLAILTLAPLDKRYWVPLTPLLVLYLVLGTKVILSWLGARLPSPRLASVAGSVFLISLIALHFYRDVQAVADPVRARIPDVAIGPTWLVENTPADVIVMAPVPRVTYIYSQRKAVPFPDGGDGHRYELSPELGRLVSEGVLPRFHEAIEQFNVDYILVEPELAAGTPFSWQPYFRDVIVPTLDQNTERFKPVYVDTSGLVRIYRVLRMR